MYFLDFSSFMLVKRSVKCRYASFDLIYYSWLPRHPFFFSQDFILQKEKNPEFRDHETGFDLWSEW